MITGKVKQYIEKEQLFAPHEKLLVALSGGADSVALLRVLLQLGYSCEAAHCNFPTTAKRYPDTEYFAYSALDVLQNAVALLKSAKNKIVMIRPKPLTELLKQ